MGPFAAFVRRAAIQSTVALSVTTAAGYGEQFRDLRGQLPARGEWGFRDVNKVDGIVIHHSATTGQSLRTMAQFHTEVRGWQGLSYHYAVGWDGTVFLCNDVDRLTFHTSGANSRNIGIVLVGNLDRNEVPEAQRMATERLVQTLQDRHPRIVNIKPHRAYKSTICPGRHTLEALSHIWN